MNDSASATIDTTATDKRAAEDSSYNYSYSSSSLLTFDVLACVVSSGVFGALLGALLAFGDVGVGASLRIQSAVACGIHAVLPFAVWFACRERRDNGHRERPAAALSVAIHLLLWTAGSLSAVYLGVFAAGLARGWFVVGGGETTTTAAAPAAVVSVASAALGLLSTAYQSWRFAIAGAVAAHHRHPPASSLSPSSGTDDDEEEEDDDDAILSVADASV